VAEPVSTRTPVSSIEGDNVPTTPPSYNAPHEVIVRAVSEKHTVSGVAQVVVAVGEGTGAYAVELHLVVRRPRARDGDAVGIVPGDYVGPRSPDGVIGRVSYGHAI
jgi:hypothetical protein